MQARLSELFQRHIKEMEGTTTNSETLILSGAKVSVGHTMAREAKDTPQEKSILSKDYSFLLNGTRIE